MVDFSKKDKFYEGSVEKKLIITGTGISLSNADLYSESFELTESICSAETLTFGAESSQCKFRVRYDVPSLKDKYITVSMQIDGQTLSIGKYIVAEDKPNGSRNYRDIVAYDIIYYINTMNFAEWYKGLTFPMTLNSMFVSFVGEVRTRLGISFDYQPGFFTNGYMNVNNPIADKDSLTDLSGAKLLTDFASATATFGHIYRDGKLKFSQLTYDTGLYPQLTLYPSDTTYPKKDSASQRFDNQYYITCTHEDFKTKKITEVQIMKEDGDIGVSSGESGNTLKIVGNMFLSNLEEADMQSACDGILHIAKNIEYTPCDLTVIGNPCLECGDLIAFKSHGETYMTYILQRTLKGIQSLRDTYVAEGDESIVESDTSLRNQIIELNGKSNVLKTTLDGTISEVKSKVDKDTYDSYVEQTAKDISAKVSQTSGGVESGFGWSLKSDGFSLSSQGEVYPFEDNYLKAQSMESTSFEICQPHDIWESGSYVASVHQIDLVTFPRTYGLSLMFDNIDDSSESISFGNSSEERSGAVYITYAFTLPSNKKWKLRYFAITNYNFSTDIHFDEVKILKNGDYKEVFRCDKDGIQVNGLATIDAIESAYAKIGTLEAESVTVDKLQTTGGVTISGDNITTGTISADVIESGIVRAKQLTIGTEEGGVTISGDNITTGTISADRIDTDILRSASVDADYLNGKYTSATVFTLNGYRFAPQTIKYVNSHGTISERVVLTTQDIQGD